MSDDRADRDPLDALGTGPAGDVECREVLEEVYLYLDGELSGQGRSVIQSHLDSCTPCLRRYGLEGELKALVARSCGREDTPLTLRDRVLTTLRTVTIDADAATVTTTVTTSRTVTEHFSS